MTKAGEDRVAAKRRDDFSIQKRGARRFFEPGEIHVPVLTDGGAGVVSGTVEADDVIEAVERHMHGIATERAEPSCKAMERFGIKPLIAHSKHAMLVQQSQKTGAGISMRFTITVK